MGFSEKRPHLSKLRGQHFLSDKAVVAKIIAAAELDADDTVLEVGPGLGVLTKEIAPRAGKLVAVELDPLYAEDLRKIFEVEPQPAKPGEVRPRRIEIIEGDILKLRIAGLIAAPYKLVTNLPYNITSAFFKKFLLEPPHPRLMIVMIQKEVAERIIPNYKPTSMLGMMCNLYAACSSIAKVPAGAFVPPPKVDSAVVKLELYSEKDFSAKWGFERGLAEDFLAFANRFFAAPRKKMSGVLAKPLAAKLRASLSALDESPDSRPAALSLAKWVELWKMVR
jgi:16S rRNA (adenine1518-N6/adenine1519-N6)-dimethyltransferase